MKYAIVIDIEQRSVFLRRILCSTYDATSDEMRYDVAPASRMGSRRVGAMLRIHIRAIEAALKNGAIPHRKPRARKRAR